jgi:carbonic anhydrase
VSDGRPDADGTVDALLARARDMPATTRPAPPRLGLAIVICMDARLDPISLFGREPGDAHIIRNSGGRVDKGALRSIALSQRMLGTREVLIVQHTGCALHGFDEEAFADQIERDTGVRPDWRAGGFRDLEESVRGAIRHVRQTEYVPHRDRIRGAIVDLIDGGVREVVAEARVRT